MTIKEASNDNTDYNGGKSSYAATASAEPDIPVAFASVLDEPRQTAVPGYAASTNTNTAYEPTATATQPTIVHGDNVTGGAVITTTTTNTNSTTTTPPPPTATVGQGDRPVPPNAPPGGQWVRVKFAGNQTWGIIGGTACCLFWFCMMITAPLALTGLLCPCDEKVAYMSPNGVIYDERGHAMGDRRRNKFTVLGKA